MSEPFEPGPAPTQTPAPVALREPAHQVSPRAVTYWRIGALISLVIEWAIALVVYFVALPEHPWWATLLLVVLLAVPVGYAVVMPALRYRIHRWEVTDTAIHTRSGWLSIDTRIAPLSRVQTVDSKQGPLMRPFGLASLTVTTASAAGPITIDCLDAELARELVARLTEITGASEGDAT